MCFNCNFLSDTKRRLHCHNLYSFTKMAPTKNRIVDANALITAGEKYDVQFLVRVCIKMLDKPLHEKNEFRDLFLGDLDDEANRKKAVLAIKAIRAEQNKSAKTMAKGSGLRT